MIQDFFRNGNGVSTVSAVAAAGFVGSVARNMAGRFCWSSTSDYIGRKPIYMVYLGVGIALYLVLGHRRVTPRPRCSSSSARYHLLLRRRIRHCSRPTSATCSAPTRWVRSTAGY